MIILASDEEWNQYCSALRNIVYHYFVYYAKEIRGYNRIPFYPCVIETEINQSITDKDVYFARHIIKDVPYATF